MTRDSIWTSQTGTRTKIKDMETRHINHAIRMIRDSLMMRRIWRVEYVETLEQELKLRQSKLYKSLK